MTLQHYLANRGRYEALLLALLLVSSALSNIFIASADLGRLGLLGSRIQLWEVAVWEISSILMIAVLLPWLFWVDARYPLDHWAGDRVSGGRESGPRRWLRRLCVHLLASVPFSLAHVFGMVALRKLVYAFAGAQYKFADNAHEAFAALGYEYVKDVQTWFLLLALLYLYRFVLRRAQGVAQEIREGETEGAAAPATSHLLVKKLGKEFLLRVDAIDWVESGGNYVSLHTRQSDGALTTYLLRSTMVAMEQRLADSGFVRVHRSAIVRLDAVIHAEVDDNGDGVLHLENQRRVPLSRRYRQTLKAQLTS